VTLRRRLVQLSVVEQRYRAVLEVQSGSSVSEVAARFGVSRQAVHRWLRWYREHGLAGLSDLRRRARRPPAHVMVVGFCIDPVEKKPLNHFLPGTPVLSFGTAGCNLACKFCQNWDISKSREIDTLADAASPQALAEAAQRLGCRSVAFTYNDPMSFLEYAMGVADACHERGIKAIAVTAGCICAEPRRDLYAHMDAANADLKAFTQDFYHRVCAGHLDDVLQTLEYLRHNTDVWFEITTLLIPGHNDSDDEIDAATRWIAEHLGPDVPLHFTAFHPDYKMRDLPPTPPATLRRARRIALAKTAYGSSTPATCTTRRAAQRTARPVARQSSSGTGTSSTATNSPTTDRVAPVGRRCPASMTARPDNGAPGGCRCHWRPPGEDPARGNPPGVSRGQFLPGRSAAAACPARRTTGRSAE
jgi:AmmeMemoRadiSam system radical SAM enzyme